MKRCLECGTEIHPREYFCGQVCFDNWVENGSMLSISPPGSSVTYADIERSHAKKPRVPEPSVELDPIDWESLPF
jgi:hypothetical protein